MTSLAFTIPRLRLVVKSYAHMNKDMWYTFEQGGAHFGRPGCADRGGSCQTLEGNTGYGTYASPAGFAAGPEGGARLAVLAPGAAGVAGGEATRKGNTLIPTIYTEFRSAPARPGPSYPISNIRYAQVKCKSDNLTVITDYPYANTPPRPQAGKRGASERRYISTPLAGTEPDRREALVLPVSETGRQEIAPGSRYGGGRG